MYGGVLMPSPVLQLQGKVNAANALVVTGDAGATTGGVQPIASCQGKVDASNRLVVVFAVA